MSRKPEEIRQPKKAQAEDKSHKPAKHIEETARLASSVERNKNQQKVGKLNTEMLNEASMELTSLLFIAI